MTELLMLWPERCNNPGRASDPRPLVTPIKKRTDHGDGRVDLEIEGPLPELVDSPDVAICGNRPRELYAVTGFVDNLDAKEGQTMRVHLLRRGGSGAG